MCYNFVDMKVRTRIAPSPTGYPHLGTAYQALINKAYAKKYKGSFVIRIEDTDRTRFVEDAEKRLYKALDWLNLTEDEGPRKGGDFGPYRQSERLSLYKKYALDLVKKGHAYYCFCTKERLEKVRKNQQKNGLPSMYDGHCRTLSKNVIQKNLKLGKSYVIRLKVPKNKKIVVHDLIRGEIVFDSNTIDDQVILKSDGFPTYHLAVVVDDHLMNITHVVRDAGWIPSFPKHKLIYDYLGWEMPIFLHTPTIINMSGGKLSKRDSSSDINWYKEQGFLPEAILNFLALLGWSHPKGKEIFDFNEFIKYFDLKDISPVTPKLDLVKLEWINGIYIRNLTLNEFLKRSLDYLPSEYTRNLDYLKKILPLVRDRVKRLSELSYLISYFFEYPKGTKQIRELALKESKKNYKQTKEVLHHIIDILDSIKDSNWTSSYIDTLLHKLMMQLNIKPRQFFMPIRIIVTGRSFSPPVADMLEVLGKQETLKRLKRF